MMTQRLMPFRQSLFQMHRHLLQALKAEREHHFQREFAPAEWLNLVTGAPEYRWLAPLTRYLADVDALSEWPGIAESDLQLVRQVWEDFFRESEGEESFRARYQRLLQKDSDLLISHSHLRKHLEALPAASTTPIADADERRQAWHERTRKNRSDLN
ncbi:MAG: hypothetical protein KF802_15835 [Bdellovibrionaceae bacterium]|nr:hypothetical protein [Pseudobdellovibrionaceae bacterium]MBX3035219.1 hypothetical protein [Pseudobdellovibrionaceae bacterium]